MACGLDTGLGLYPMSFPFLPLCPSHGAESVIFKMQMGSDHPVDLKPSQTSHNSQDKDPVPRHGIRSPAGWPCPPLWLQVPPWLPSSRDGPPGHPSCLGPPCLEQPPCLLQLPPAPPRAARPQPWAPQTPPFSRATSPDTQRGLCSLRPSASPSSVCRGRWASAHLPCETRRSAGPARSVLSTFSTQCPVVPGPW